MLADKHHRLKGESGFTLVELLVVILIIGVLAAIAIPAFMDQRKRANDAAVKSDIKMIANEIETLLISEPNAYSVSDGQVSDTGNFNWSDDNIDSLWLRATTRPGGGSVVSESLSEEIFLSDGVHIDVVGHANSSPNPDSPLGSHNYLVYGWHDNGKEYIDRDSALLYASNEGGFVN